MTEKKTFVSLKCLDKAFVPTGYEVLLCGARGLGGLECTHARRVGAGGGFVSEGQRECFWTLSESDNQGDDFAPGGEI